ncbi:hypothetical protein, partial [Mesorhizobium japonicum]|uniref:hypothetical protein n=1 Tax=Mesorhizobium japonicum TaxID=2066070 RepID=UPI003B5B9F52
WDVPKAPATGERRGTLRVRRVLGARMRVRMLRSGADPVELPVRLDDTHGVVELAFDAAPWTMLDIELDAEGAE